MRRGFFLFFLGLGLLAGCGKSKDESDSSDKADPRCLAFCKEGNSCPDGTGDTSGCNLSCVLLDGVNEASGCGDEFEGVLACEEGLMNVCDDMESQQCNTPNVVWLDCIVAYCAANPDSFFCG